MTIVKRVKELIVKIIEKSARSLMAPIGFANEGEMRYYDNGRVVTVTDEQSDECTFVAPHVSAGISLYMERGRRILIKASRERGGKG